MADTTDKPGCTRLEALRREKVRRLTDQSAPPRDGVDILKVRSGLAKIAEVLILRFLWIRTLTLAGAGVESRRCAPDG